MSVTRCYLDFDFLIRSITRSFPCTASSARLRYCVLSQRKTRLISERLGALGSERDRLIAGVTIDFEDEVTSSLNLFPCGFGSLGFDYDPAPTLGYYCPSLRLGMLVHFFSKFRFALYPFPLKSLPPR